MYCVHVFTHEWDKNTITPEHLNTLNMERREAIKNTVLFLGYSVSFTALSETFIACNKAVSVDWEPVFLSKAQANTISEITETILPKTSTPGAKDLGVPQFIDKMLKDLLSEEDQKGFIADLDTFEKDCKAANGKAFVDCDQAQREAYLLKLDKAAAKPPSSFWGISTVAKPEPVAFFRSLKGLTLMGYYTSEEVGLNILRYDPVPGEYIACMPLEGQNSWSE